MGLKYLAPLAMLAILFSCSDDAVAPKTEVVDQFEIKQRSVTVTTLGEIESLDAEIEKVQRLGDKEACVDHKDCISGLCMPTELGKICTTTCQTTENCTGGFVCIIDQLQAEDQIRFCAPKQEPSFLCQRCDQSENCGSTDDFCIQFDEHHHYCAKGCERDLDCPDHYKCQDVSIDSIFNGSHQLQKAIDQEVVSYDEQNQTIKQCMPVNQECESCVDQDGDGFGVGSGCLGLDCNDQNVDVHAQGKEICDGLDNDCNDKIDDALVVSEALKQELNCLTQGVCANVEILCQAGTWQCSYNNQYEEEEQRCDGFDNNCNGQIDEHIDFQNDVNHCGNCFTHCQAIHATTACVMGECQLQGCEAGYYDINRERNDGCEYQCQFNGAERCDGADNDCDGKFDEDFDFNSIENCGGCGITCQFNHAQASCVEGTCQLDACYADFVNLNTQNADGCEYACHFTGNERCDYLDNDCNGSTDEGFDLQRDINNCGACQRVCHYDHAQTLCAAGNCLMGACLPNYYNLNGNQADGCEYACHFTSDIDEPDEEGIDSNCDGIDGEITKGVFVALSGRPNGTGRMDDPINSISGGINKAIALGRNKHVYVSQGTYWEKVSLSDQIKVFGGYDRSNHWARNIRENQSSIQANTIAVEALTVVHSGLSGFTIIGGVGDRENFFGSSYAIYLKDSGDLLFEDNQIFSSDALDGRPGINGINGVNGNSGAMGEVGCANCGQLGRGGNGGESSCGSNGGKGGLGGYNNAEAYSGAPGLGHLGGIGGLKQIYGCSVAGGEGVHGGHAVAASNGSAGRFYRLRNGKILSDDGEDGSVGEDGGGGGGGAGGTGTNECISCDFECFCNCNPDRGGGGGGGGGGGCGATGGTGGEGGGSSVGVLSINTLATFRYNQIFSGHGGNGGRGGNGGIGGAGGTGALGGTGKDDAGAGGKGGNGGNGGKGGDGGGGQGGMSYCIVSSGGQIALLLNSCSNGSPGTGGDSEGNQGANGNAGYHFEW